MATSKLAVDSAYSVYAEGVKLMWSKIDDLIKMDTSSSGKSNYENVIISSFLKTFVSDLIL